MVARPLLSVLLLISLTTVGSAEYNSLRDIIGQLSSTCLENAERYLSGGILQILRGQEQSLTQIVSGQQSLQGQVADLQKQLAALRPAPEGCPATWSRHGDSCYFIPQQTANWLQAHRACAMLDRRARLASIHGDSKQHVEAYVAGSGAKRVWVGLLRLSASDWGWSDGTPLDVTNWSSGDPNNLPLPSNCAQVNGPEYGGPRGWNDFDCYHANHFLCQIDLA